MSCQPAEAGDRLEALSYWDLIPHCRREVKGLLIPTRNETEELHADCGRDERGLARR